MQPPSDHLLRTLAAVPVEHNVLEVGCGTGRHTEPLLRLGFPVHACDTRAEAVATTREHIADLVGAETATQCVQQVALDELGTYPEDAFHWIVAYDPVGYVDRSADVPNLLETLRRLLVPGGWLYVALRFPDGWGSTANGVSTVVTEMIPQQLDAFAADAGLASAVAAEQATEQGTPLVRAIFRYVTDATPQ